MRKFQIGRALLVSASFIATGCFLDPCDDLVDADRERVRECFTDDRRDWGEEGVCHDQGGVYSVMWVDYDFYEIDSIINWRPDTRWTREVLVLQHASGDPGLPGDDDTVLLHQTLKCENECHFLGSCQIKLISTKTWGESPIPFGFGCGEMPGSILQPAEVIWNEACYDSHLCPMGTMCFTAQVDVECPPAGSICVESEDRVPPLLDTDGDGIHDCEDDDIDGDGLLNQEERTGSLSGWPTDPYDPDTDGDGTDDSADATPLTELCSSIIYQHVFNEDPGDEWTAVAGSWAWDGDSAYLSNSTHCGALAWIGERSWTDYVVIVRLRSTATTGSAGLVARVQSVSPETDSSLDYCYVIYPGQNRASLGYFDGAWHVMQRATPTIDPGVSYTLQLRMTGADLEGYLGNDLLFAASNALYDSGSIGLRTCNCTASCDFVLVCE